MNYQEACEIFELHDSTLGSVDEEGNIDLEKVRKQYLKLCLKYHPDKNGGEGVAQFQKIQEAYLILMDDQEDLYEEEENTQEVMISQLPKWLQTMIPYLMEFRENPLFLRIIGNLETRVMKWAESLDKELLLNIYDFICKITKKGENITFLEDILSNIIKKKTANDRHILLEPPIENLFACNVIRHIENNHIYMIPSWIEESVFDLILDDTDYKTDPTPEIIFTCIPKCPPDVYLDEYRNVHKHISISFDRDLLERSPTENSVEICPNVSIQLNLTDLYLKKEQIVIFRGKGIPKANTKNLMDVRKFSDIILHVTFI